MLLPLRDRGRVPPRSAAWPPSDEDSSKTRQRPLTFGLILLVLLVGFMAGTLVAYLGLETSLVVSLT